MSDHRSHIIATLPPRHRQALDVVEAAGGTVSNFVLNLIADAEMRGLTDDEILEALKQHYAGKQSTA